MTPRRFGFVVLVALADLGIWSLAALFATSEFYRRSVVMGGIANWHDVLGVQMCTAFIWATLTPLVYLIARNLPLREPHRLRNLLAIIVFIPYLAVFRAALGGVILNLGEHDPVALSMVELSIGIRTHRNIAILAAIFFVTNLIDAQREAAERERRRMHAQTLLARAELDELRTRLQPRFAIRMLRHIASVLRNDPAAADELIVSLSSILRRSMGRDTDERIPLGDELEHLDRCLDLCRIGGRYAVDARYVASEDVLACRVPAHALQPAIESLVLDVTDGNRASIEVHCKHEGADARIDIRSNVSPAKTLFIPCEEPT